MATFNLQIVTPNRLFFKGEAEMVIVRTTQGDIAILKDHINYVATLDIGEVRIKQNGNFRNACIAGGFIQVDEEQTTIVTQSAEWPEEIDIERAKRAKERAESQIHQGIESIELAAAEAKLKRAISRINTVEKRF